MIADGKLIAHILEQKLSEHSATVPTKKVCFILFGDNPGSKQFVAMKSRVAERLGIVVKVLHYLENISTDEAVRIIQEVSREQYAGIVIQLPLPTGLDRDTILNSVPVDIDIDMLGDEAKKRFLAKKTNIIPPVARAVNEILNFYTVNVREKNILIVGRGKLVGEPIGMLFSVMNIPYNIIDIDTNEKEKIELLQSADIIISGAGAPGFILPSMIKEGVVLIDAGTSEQNGKLVGDVDPLCEKKASLITPVPGGVGPVTVMSLFLNLYPKWRESFESYPKNF